MCIHLPCGYSSQTLTKVIAYCEVAIYIVGIVVCTLFGVMLESRPDLLMDVAHEKPIENQDILMLLQLPLCHHRSPMSFGILMQIRRSPVQSCFVLWLVMNFIAGLIFSIILLRGAQERNLTKVKIWYVITIVGYVLWLPIFVFWMYHSLEPVNIVFSTLMSYLFGGLCLRVVYAFMEELRIEGITHRPGFKTVTFSKI